MKLLALSLLVFISCIIYGEEGNGSVKVVSLEKVECKVLDKFSINDDGYLYASYIVDYKGNKITITSPVSGIENINQGDTVTISVIKMIGNDSGKSIKMLTFSINPLRK